MEQSISAADWKLLRQLEPVALERFCQRVLAEVSRRASDSTKGSHARYLDVFQLIHERNDELGAAFNNLKRSTAFLPLARMRSLGLVTDEEFAGFSPQTQSAVALFLELWNAGKD
jgi:hypothetical protein